MPRMFEKGIEYRKYNRGTKEMEVMEDPIDLTKSVESLIDFLRMSDISKKTLLYMMAEHVIWVNSVSVSAWEGQRHLSRLCRNLLINEDDVKSFVTLNDENPHAYCTELKNYCFMLKGRSDISNMWSIVRATSERFRFVDFTQTLKDLNK